MSRPGRAGVAVVLALAGMAILAGRGPADAVAAPGMPLPLPEPAAPPSATGAAVLSGVVHNATTDRPAAHVPVQLVFVEGSQGADVVGQARADAAGRFAFRGLPTGRYLVTAVHQGVSYASHTIVAGPQTEAVLRVYDVSAQVPLRVSLLGMAVQAFPGYVRISEVLHLQNPSTRTFFGAVTVPLPAGARYVVFNEGLHQPRVQGPQIEDRLIIRPGAHQIAYTYSVAGDGEVALDRRLPLPVDRIEMFVGEPAEARSPRLQPLPSVTNDGHVYTRASGRAVPAGALALSILGVPATRRWVPAVAAGLLAAILATGVVWAIVRLPDAGGLASRVQNR